MSSEPEQRKKDEIMETRPQKIFIIFLLGTLVLSIPISSYGSGPKPPAMTGEEIEKAREEGRLYGPTVAPPPATTPPPVAAPPPVMPTDEIKQPRTPVLTRSPVIKQCAERLGRNTGREHKDERLRLEIPENDYIRFMREDLNVYTMSSDPSVTSEQRERARMLLNYLMYAASDQDRQWIAEIYVNSYFDGRQE